MAEFVNLLQSEAAPTLKDAFRKCPLEMNLTDSWNRYNLLKIAKQAKKWLGIRRHQNVGLSVMDQSIFASMYGESASVLGNKAEFPGLMKRIGFSAPDSVLVKPEDNRTESQKSILDVIGSRNTYFVKPLDGINEIGAHSIEACDLTSELEQLTQPTLVQEFIPHKRCIRCIRYQDKNGKIYFAAFEYDDKTRVGQVFDNSTKDNLKNLYKLLHVQAAPANDKETNNLFLYIEEAVAALQNSLNIELPFFSCDLALREGSESIISGEKYNSEEMKTATSFIETQNFPGPWEMKHKNTSRPIATYLYLWELFIKEHGKEMIARLPTRKAA